MSTGLTPKEARTAAAISVAPYMLRFRVMRGRKAWYETQEERDRAFVPAYRHAQANGVVVGRVLGIVFGVGPDTIKHWAGQARVAGRLGGRSEEGSRYSAEVTDLNDARVRLWALINDPDRIDEFNAIWKIIATSKES